MHQGSAELLGSLEGRGDGGGHGGSRRRSQTPSGGCACEGERRGRAARGREEGAGGAESLGRRALDTRLVRPMSTRRTGDLNGHETDKIGVRLGPCVGVALMIYH